MKDEKSNTNPIITNKRMVFSTALARCLYRSAMCRKVMTTKQRANRFCPTPAIWLLMKFKWLSIVPQP